MTGLDHKRADLAVREMFALTKENTQRLLASIKGSEGVSGCVIISTCNRTELYVSLFEEAFFEPSKALCAHLGRDHAEFGALFSDTAGERALEHLCRVASGLDSQIVGDDQIITQVRDALELSRCQGCTDSYVETAFKLAVKAAKSIKTNVILKSHQGASIPAKAVEKLKTTCDLDGRNAVVIGNGQMGRLAGKLLLDERMNVTVTLREYKKGVIDVPDGANTIGYSERYKAIGQSDVVVSATTSPHFTIHHKELAGLARLPDIIVDLAVPRDVEPLIGEIPGVMLLTIDDITGESRALAPESLIMIEAIIEEHVGKYNRWLRFKEGVPLNIKVYAVGLGPGDPGYMTPEAREAIKNSDVIIGYTGYVELIRELTVEKKVVVTGMKSERKRCESAIKEALKGKKVAVVSSGDAGIYGMAGLLYELAEKHPEVEIEVIPGVTAANSAAAVLGSPLTNDFAVISLSDLLTPWDVIEKRLDAASAADFVLCFYNPQSKRRRGYLEKACRIALRHKPHETKCGYVRNAFRGGNGESRVCTLAELAEAPVDMFTTVIIGNSCTKVINGKLVTVRGYSI